METKEKETELVQLVRQLRDYVILDRKDYEKHENSRGLRLGFFIELAGYFIFYFFLNCCVCGNKKQKYFFDFSNCDKCIKTRNSNESHPGIYFRIGVSPHDKNKFIHIQKLKAQ